MSLRLLPSQMVLAHMDACLVALRAELAFSPARDEAEIVLSGEEVAAIDTAGVQLLLAAARSATDKQRTLRIVRCSPELSRALALSGANARLLFEEERA